MSDPSVQAQAGMRVGIPNAGQLNALETLNIRGERSVTCKGAFDAHPSTGPLPPGAPAECEAFRKQPDALERAAELDAQYGRNPDLAALPMYCVVAAFKDPFDTKDMRTTANSDVAFAMDVPPFDATVVARLRAKGAIIYAKSNAHEFNAGPGDPGGKAQSRTNAVAGRTGDQRVGGPGMQSVRHRTRAARIEQRIRGRGLGEPGDDRHLRADRRVVPGAGVAQRHRDAADHEGRSAGQRRHREPVVHRPRRHPRAHACRRREGARRGQGPDDRLLRLRAILHGDLPKRSSPTSRMPALPSAMSRSRANPKPLQGMRIAHPAGAHGEADAEPRGDFRPGGPRDQGGAARQARRRAGRDRSRPAYPDDPDVPNVKYTFADALSELLPRLMPEIFTRRDDKGELLFAVPGYDVTSYDYLRKLSGREAPLTDKITIINFATYGVGALLYRPMQRRGLRHRPLSGRPQRRDDQDMGRLGRACAVPRRCVARWRRELGWR